MTRIVIADDHPMFREGLAKAIELDKDFSIVGQAGDGAEALRLIKEILPDLAVLDVSMPKMDGLEVARTVHQEALPTEIVILTMYRDLGYFNVALDLGVRGYILKDSARAEFLSCLRSVKDGQYYISPSIAHLLIEREKNAQGLAASIPALQRLTPAEKAILKLVAQNFTSREISEKIFVSVRTVENHRLHICQKLGITGHNKLLEFAIQNKFAL
ncbi:MAG: response regulator transcription factor [Ignavibacteriales bacterium]|nr:response regulator transcription factor [Ignavibacteriales bacterium]